MQQMKQYELEKMFSILFTYRIIKIVYAGMIIHGVWAYMQLIPFWKWLMQSQMEEIYEKTGHYIYMDKIKPKGGDIT